MRNSSGSSRRRSPRVTTMLSLAATPGGYWKTGVGSVSAGPARVARVRRGRSLVAGAGAAPAASSSDESSMHSGWSAVAPASGRPRRGRRGRAAAGAAAGVGSWRRGRAGAGAGAGGAWRAAAARRSGFGFGAVTARGGGPRRFGAGGGDGGGDGDGEDKTSSELSSSPSPSSSSSSDGHRLRAADEAVDTRATLALRRRGGGGGAARGPPSVFTSILSTGPARKERGGDVSSLISSSDASAPPNISRCHMLRCRALSSFLGRLPRPVPVGRRRFEENDIAVVRSRARCSFCQQCSALAGAGRDARLPKALMLSRVFQISGPTKALRRPLSRVSMRPCLIF